MDDGVENLDYITNCGALGTTAEMVFSGGALESPIREMNQFGFGIGKYQASSIDSQIFMWTPKASNPFAITLPGALMISPEELARAVSMAKGYSS